MQRSNLRRILARIVLVTSSILMVFTGPAEAESPTEVAADILGTGVYVAPERRDEVDLGRLLSAVEVANEAGLRISVVVPAHPIPNSEAFARRVFEATGGSRYDAVLVIDPAGAHQVEVSDEYQNRKLRTIEAAQRGSSPTESVALASVAMLSEPQASVPAALEVIDAWVIWLVLLLAVSVIVDLLIRQRRRRRYRSKLAVAPDPGMHSNTGSHASIN